MFGNISKMMSLMGQAKQIQANIAAAQTELEQMRIEGQSGGVRIVMNGKLDLISVHVGEPTVPADLAAQAESDVSVALRSTMQQAREAARQKMSEATGGMDMNALLGGSQG